ILHSTYFVFDGVMYKQNYGTPIMRKLEDRALSLINFQMSFYYRYVDDIILAAPVSLVNHIIDIFNSQHPRLQFTMEVGGDRLNFLDVTVIRNNELIEFDWYHKPTFSGRYLNFWSQHPVSHKRGTVMGLVDRVILLSNPKFHFDNLCFIIKVLLENDYPLKFIFDNILIVVRRILLWLEIKGES
ncbi:hypothetical protein ALC62_10460, partial [Cyphomyrmex costatus]